MQYRPMADHHIFTNHKRPTIGGVCALVCGMQHRVVLHVRTLAHHDRQQIATQHRPRPDAHVIPQHNVADDRCRRIDVHPPAELR